MTHLLFFTSIICQTFIRLQYRQDIYFYIFPNPPYVLQLLTDFATIESDYFFLYLNIIDS